MAGLYTTLSELEEFPPPPPFPLRSSTEKLPPLIKFLPPFSPRWGVLGHLVHHNDIALSVQHRHAQAAGLMKERVSVPTGSLAYILDLHLQAFPGIVINNLSTVLAIVHVIWIYRTHNIAPRALGFVTNCPAAPLSIRFYRGH